MDPSRDARIDLLGRTVGGIRVVDLLGQGAMGEVYAGYHEKLQRRVALKRIRPELALDAQMKERFLREAQILSQVQHPNICQVFDYLESEHGDLIVLELVPGASLGDSMRKGGLTEEEKLAIAGGIAEALVAAHGVAVVHRDLKPANVMISEEGAVKVLDFGLARSVAMDEEETLAWEALASAPDAASSWLPADSVLLRTNAGMLVGTPSYMSPEQARGEPATPASDLYSFGLILQELFTGEPCYDGRARGPELLRRAAEARTRPAKGVGRARARLIRALKRPDPVERPTSEQVAALLRLWRETPSRGHLLGELTVGVLALAAVCLVTIYGVGRLVSLADDYGSWPGWISLALPLLCPSAAVALLVWGKRWTGALPAFDPLRWVRGFSLLYLGGFLGFVMGGAFDGFLLDSLVSAAAAVAGCLLAIGLAKREMRRAAGGGK